MAYTRDAHDPVNPRERLIQDHPLTSQMRMTPIQIAALKFVAETRTDRATGRRLNVTLSEISEPMRQRLIDLAMMEPPLVDVYGDTIVATDAALELLAHIKFNERYMVRKIERSYAFSDREIREALLGWLRAKNIPSPTYVGDTPDCKWIKEEGGLRVEWTEEDEIELGEARIR